MAGLTTGQLIVDPGAEDCEEGLPSSNFHFVSCDGSSNIWEFVEPLPTSKVGTIVSTSPDQPAAFWIKLAAPVELDPVDAYMHFARIRDTAGCKLAQYQKYYGNESTFLHSVNQRFGTSHSLGVLKGWLSLARDKRKQKRKGAMSVKVLQVETISGPDGPAGLHTSGFMNAESPR